MREKKEKIGKSKLKSFLKENALFIKMRIPVYKFRVEFSINPKTRIATKAKTKHTNGFFS